MNSDIPRTLEAGNMTFEYVKSGKVKNIYESRDGFLLFYFTDQISVFDKVIPSLIPGKGEALCRGTGHWFQRIKEHKICKTHYVGISNTEPNQMMVEKARRVDRPTVETDAYQIPLEVIARYYAAGSLIDRIKDGELKPQDVGLSSIPKPGDKLPEPWFDFETKFEDIDRKLTRNEAMEIGGLRSREIAEIIETVLKIDNMMAREVEPRGLVHADGKKEFAYASGRELMLIDTFGTADEDRWWDRMALENGQLIEKSKEFVRQHYRNTGYHAELMKARKAKVAEPPISSLPENMIVEVSDLYAKLYEQLTGEAF